MRIWIWVLAWAAVCILVGSMILAGHWWLHAVGWDTQQSDNYAAFSGSLPFFATTIGLSTLITGAWHHLNCHVDGCPLIGRYPLAGGAYKVCRRHHPDENVQNRQLTEHHIHLAHRKHQDAQAP